MRREELYLVEKGSDIIAGNAEKGFVCSARKDVLKGMGESLPSHGVIFYEGVQPAYPAGRKFTELEGTPVYFDSLLLVRPPHGHRQP